MAQLVVPLAGARRPGVRRVHAQPPPPVKSCPEDLSISYMTRACVELRQSRWPGAWSRGAPCRIRSTGRLRNGSSIKPTRRGTDSALNRMTAEALVVLEPHGVFAVAPEPDLAGYAEPFDACALLQVRAAGLAATRAGVADLSALRLAVDGIARARCAGTTGFAPSPSTTAPSTTG